MTPDRIIVFHMTGIDHTVIETLVITEMVIPLCTARQANARKRLN
jgi:hypothetical protein